MYYKQLIKFHVLPFLELLEEDLRSSPPLKRTSEYTAYFAWAFVGKKLTLHMKHVHRKGTHTHTITNTKIKIFSEQ